MAFIPIYILILFALIIIDYFAGILIEKNEDVKRKKIILIVSIFSTCLALSIFKYFNFFVTNINEIAKFLHWNYSIGLLHIILPIGLSFHTFQSMAYVIEVYRGNQKAERHLGIYALYVMFYPQLVSGPIERPQNLLHQFYEQHSFDYKRVTDGLKLMLWGVFKKVVIADRLAPFVNEVYNHPHDWHGISLIVATVFFVFQIYCDFSGYSDIAIGSAQVMGFKLMLNFQRPYFSESIAKFWRRWHISLSSWLRDYLFTPLLIATRNWGMFSVIFSLAVAWTIIGLWHGANWTYIVFGSIHGLYLIISFITRKTRKKIVNLFQLDKFVTLHKFIAVLFTFSLVCFADIFFRANSISDAFYIVTHLFTGLREFTVNFITNITSLSSGKDVFGDLRLKQPKINFAIVIFNIMFLLSIQLIQRKNSVINIISQKPIWVRWALYYIIVFAILIYGAFNANMTFIYFQF